jgi:hypothetical protein
MTSALINPCAFDDNTRPEHSHTQNFPNNLGPNIFFRTGANKSSEKKPPSRAAAENILRMASESNTNGPASQLTLGSIEPVKIAFRWRILNDMDACQK